MDLDRAAFVAHSLALISVFEVARSPKAREMAHQNEEGGHTLDVGDFLGLQIDWLVNVAKGGVAVVGDPNLNRDFAEVAERIIRGSQAG